MPAAFYRSPGLLLAWWRMCPRRFAAYPHYHHLLCGMAASVGGAHGAATCCGRASMQRGHVARCAARQQYNAGAAAPLIRATLRCYRPSRVKRVPALAPAYLAHSPPLSAFLLRGTPFATHRLTARTCRASTLLPITRIRNDNAAPAFSRREYAVFCVPHTSLHGLRSLPPTTLYSACLDANYLP